MNYRFLRFPDGKQKAVTFSYDDGCRDDIRLVEILNRYKIKCTFNINSACIPEKDGALYGYHANGGKVIDIVWKDGKLI